MDQQASAGVSAKTWNDTLGLLNRKGFVFPEAAAMCETNVWALNRRLSGKRMSLLVPRERLLEDFHILETNTEDINAHPRLRRLFAQRLSDKYNVNANVIEVRLDREGIWLAQ